MPLGDGAFRLGQAEPTIDVIDEEFLIGRAAGAAAEAAGRDAPHAQLPPMDNDPYFPFEK